MVKYLQAALILLYGVFILMWKFSFIMDIFKCVWSKMEHDKIFSSM